MPNILLIENERIVREGLKLFLQYHLDANVVEFPSLEEATGYIFTGNMEAIIVSLPTQATTILGSIQKTKGINPQAPILLLGAMQDDFHRVRFLQAGVSGYISRDASPEEFIRAFNTVISGGDYIPQEVSRSLLESPTSRALHETLSNREYQILTLLAAGKTATEIGEQLHLSIKTISTYKARITEKTGLDTKYSMAQYAAAHNLL